MYTLLTRAPVFMVMDCASANAAEPKPGSSSDEIELLGSVELVSPEESGIELASGRYRVSATEERPLRREGR